MSNASLVLLSKPSELTRQAINLGRAAALKPLPDPSQEISVKWELTQAGPIVGAAEGMARITFLTTGFDRPKNNARKNRGLFRAATP